MPVKKSSSNATKNKEKLDDKYYTYVSYSSSSVVTPEQNIQKELVFQNNSGKIKGSYVQKENGKQIVNKEFKSQKGFEAIQKLLAKEKLIKAKK